MQSSKNGFHLFYENLCSIDGKVKFDKMEGYCSSCTDILSENITMYSFCIVYFSLICDHLPLSWLLMVTKDRYECTFPLIVLLQMIPQKVSINFKYPLGIILCLRGTQQANFSPSVNINMLSYQLSLHVLRITFGYEI